MGRRSRFQRHKNRGKTGDRRYVFHFSTMEISERQVCPQFSPVFWQCSRLAKTATDGGYARFKCNPSTVTSRSQIRKSLSEQPTPPARFASFGARCLLSTLLRQSSPLVPQEGLLLLLVLPCSLVPGRGLLYLLHCLLCLLHRLSRQPLRCLCRLLRCLLSSLCRLLIQIHHKM